jgi:hypothetical protein
VLIGVVVHPINTLAHPSVPPGWRWAVHVGDDWADLSTCLNAHWDRDEYSARLMGEAAAICAAKVARLLGSDVTTRSQVLDGDPIKPGSDLIKIGS